MEHKLILGGGEQYLPFARSRIKALRATGLRYGSQKFEIDGSSVEVRIDGQHDYIRISGGGINDLLIGLHDTEATLNNPGPPHTNDSYMSSTKWVYQTDTADPLNALKAKFRGKTKRSRAAHFEYQYPSPQTGASTAFVETTVVFTTTNPSATKKSTSPLWAINGTEKVKVSSSRPTKETATTYPYTETRVDDISEIATIYVGKHVFSIPFEYHREQVTVKPSADTFGWVVTNTYLNGSGTRVRRTEDFEPDVTDLNYQQNNTQSQKTYLVKEVMGDGRVRDTLYFSAIAYEIYSPSAPVYTPYRVILEAPYTIEAVPAPDLPLTSWPPIATDYTPQQMGNFFYPVGPTWMIINGPFQQGVIESTGAIYTRKGVETLTGTKTPINQTFYIDRANPGIALGYTLHANSLRLKELVGSAFKGSTFNLEDLKEPMADADFVSSLQTVCSFFLPIQGTGVHWRKKSAYKRFWNGSPPVSAVDPDSGNLNLSISSIDFAFYPNTNTHSDKTISWSPA